MNINNLDNIDRQIIDMLEEDPSITHNSLARHLDRSQPAIGSRIKKLQDLGILGHQYGLNFTHIQGLELIKIEMNCKNPLKLLNSARDIPNIINILKISGSKNILVLMACSSLKKLDILVDKYFRSATDISNVSIEMITGFGKPFVLPVKLKDTENLEK